jgi:hypothetical protein
VFKTDLEFQEHNIALHNSELRLKPRKELLSRPPSGKMFSDARIIRDPKNPNKWACNECMKSHKMESNIMQHIKAAHAVDVHRCNECNKFVKNLGDGKDHVRKFHRPAWEYYEGNVSKLLTRVDPAPMKTEKR